MDPYAIQFLIRASKNGDLERVKKLFRVSQTPPSSDDKNYALVAASENGHLPIVEYLCEMFPPGTPGGVEIRVSSYEPLTEASRNGHLQVVIYLLEKVFNDTNTDIKWFIEIMNESALELAAIEGHLPVVKYIMERFPPGSILGLPYRNLEMVFTTTTDRVREFMIFKILSGEWNVPGNIQYSLYHKYTELVEKVRQVTEAIKEKFPDIHIHITKYLY